MILPALVEYYGRLAAADATLAPFGWSRQKIGFVVVLEPDGSLHAIESAPGGEDKAKRRFTLVVPGQAKPSGAGINPCFLWDNPTYLLGQPPEGREDAAWTRTRFEAFRDRHLALESAIDDPGFRAVCTFLRSWSPDALAGDTGGTQRPAGFGVFRLRTGLAYVHESPAAARYWNQQVQVSTGGSGEAPSLVTGESEPVARIHEPKIKGAGGQAAGTLLISFNMEAVESYGKLQGFNAPVGELDAFRYCTALNRLLADERRRARVGDATVVFWSAKPHPIEDVTGHLFDGGEDPEVVQRVESFLASLRAGAPSDVLEEARTPFYVLGLSANASRLSVRFWLASSVAGFAERLARHATAFALDGAPGGYAFPSIRRLVAETAPSRGGWPDEERVSPILAGELSRSILGGGPYPRSLLVGVIRRMRVDGFVDAGKRKDWRAAMHRRASIVKACLVDGGLNTDQEVPMSLNEEQPEVSYQLGRMFAVLEKTQEEALGRGVNSTIRDRYFGAASSTPATVFPRLLRLHAHHLDKVEHAGRRVNLSRLVGSICDRIDPTAGFPSHLSLEAQGLFFLGYYQQRQDLFKSRKASEPDVAEAA